MTKRTPFFELSEWPEPVVAQNDPRTPPAIQWLRFLAAVRAREFPGTYSDASADAEAQRP